MKLKNCPFCGTYPIMSKYHPDMKSAAWHIYCGHYHCKIKPFLGYYEYSKEGRIQCIQDWNTRVDKD